MNALKKMYNNVVAKPAAKLYLVAGSSVASIGAHAAGEGTDAASQLTAALTTVGTIGAAVLTVYVSIKVFKMIRAAL